ncbi:MULTISPECIES: cytochrome b6-f complex subunit PetL [Leptolyngbya]|jgi:hypothetical protein|uniref:Cytochrome b6-f complex subunit 6 n=2 Tax=Leptolyngbya boryana TaxID=1184 RepID=A0A1Z4JAM0_LEPBY|nr:MULTISPECIES: cytochrome b6-f complex subunit PetL [Leptolyngbya]BAY53825.1 cytochrome b6-f complex subunit 6 [Leptolyngbya boryana NIES-2135]MBD1858062.1 cytochrome B6 [Leptolyngbya sp. FACHB-1624]MBD2367736.1 cytochrome B6 [Leptolyngbya sp. FACHB-161]MBD2374416.1 cytochrome B6 [Leptolyngbya sp. FACHB-238]MBD2398638.1 cytochrome B6 [Leptolyngbya sp. FACHB-239]
MAVVTYFALVGSMIAVAYGLFLAFRSIKLI